MNQYINPMETPKKEAVAPSMDNADITQLRLYILDLNKRVTQLEKELIRTSSELKTIRDVAHSAARKK